MKTGWVFHRAEQQMPVISKPAKAVDYQKGSRIGDIKDQDREGEAQI